MYGLCLTRLSVTPRFTTRKHTIPKRHQQNLSLDRSSKRSSDNMERREVKKLSTERSKSLDLRDTQESKLTFS